ncbi:cob(I)yrinic acid a,c-diamide adenosyltransferase [Clostridium cochlearium]|uniref:Corrinoid adenosyltransferase n=1 Tax=Clostridium cochlearium TaxID=1494 RepID=A0A7Y3V6I6_CLOCO|nr:cob(I)yrinic acid a,c-diamide adenosyltransferase [Clostridium cochlearium]NOH15603.1 cob(I)yrinic acid a,c-diamide adenosyltransferase [Clostridium cochlearium]
MKIYTKGGDKGQTFLIGGERTYKYDDRVWAYGTIDELNSSLGLARAKLRDENFRKVLLKIQKQLFELAAELASTGTDKYKENISEKDVEFLEKIIDELNEEMPSLNSFIVPGGTEESATLDVARTVARKGERYIVKLESNYYVNKNLLKYMNRLSDLIYTLARIIDYRQVLKESKKRVSIISKDIKMNREIAEYLMEKLLKKSEEIKVPMVICIVDESGNPIMFQRMDGALLASINISIGKAYSAVAFRMSTDKLKELALPQGELYGINNMKKIITFGGGEPLIVNGRIIGGIGVSGGTVEEDMMVAQFGKRTFEEVASYGIK